MHNAQCPGKTPPETSRTVLATCVQRGGAQTRNGTENDLGNPEKVLQKKTLRIRFV